MPPVFGPWSPSRRRLWSRAGGSARQLVVSQIAITLASVPSKAHHDPAARLAEELLDHGRADRLLGVVGVLAHRDALARGQPVGLHGHRATKRTCQAHRLVRIVRRAAVGDRDPGGRCHLPHQALLPTRRAASRPGPNTAMPRLQLVGNPNERRFGPLRPHPSRTARQPPTTPGRRSSRSSAGRRDVSHARVTGRRLSDPPRPRRSAATRAHAPALRIRPRARGRPSVSTRHRAQRAGCDPTRAHDRLGPLVAHERDRDAREVFEQVDVGGCLGRQLLHGPHRTEFGRPARQRR